MTVTPLTESSYAINYLSLAGSLSFNEGGCFEETDDLSLADFGAVAFGSDFGFASSPSSALITFGSGLPSGTNFIEIELTQWRVSFFVKRSPVKTWPK